MKGLSKELTKRLTVTIVIAVIILVIIVLYTKSTVFKEISLIIISSYIMAYILKPFHRYLISKGLHSKISAILIILSIFTVVILTLIFFIPNLFKESLNIEKIVYEGESIIKSIIEKLNLQNVKIINIDSRTIYDKINHMIIDFSQNVIMALIRLGDSFISLAVIPVITYYIISDGDFLRRKFLLIFPGKQRQLLKNVALDVDRLLSRYILSQIILCFIIGFLTFISLFILKVDFPIWLSLFNGILNIIPYFGPLFGAIPAVFIALLQSTEKAVWTGALLFIIQQIEGDIVSPKIVGECIRIHPIMIIILLLIGQKLGGFIGMVLAVPIAVILKVIYEDINYHMF